MRSPCFKVVAVMACLALGAPRLLAGEPVPFPKVSSLLKQHCSKCHDSTVGKPKGDLRIDKLDPDLVRGKDGDHWQEVLNRLNFGDMPPKEEPQLGKEERELITGWIVREMRRAALTRNPATHFRRLTRREYERTIQDLLGIGIEFGARLPEDEIGRAHV